MSVQSESLQLHLKSNDAIIAGDICHIIEVRQLFVSFSQVRQLFVSFSQQSLSEKVFLKHPDDH
jgi:hypothetical protein